ncbi:DUF7550 family protein [Natrialbaceae archaeon A-gly3]
MADTSGHDSAADVGEDLGAKRTTAPMSEYATRDVAVGFVVLAVGLVVAFGLPLLAL